MSQVGEEGVESSGPLEKRTERKGGKETRGARKRRKEAKKEKEKKEKEKKEVKRDAMVLKTEKKMGVKEIEGSRV